MLLLKIILFSLFLLGSFGNLQAAMPIKNTFDTIQLDQKVQKKFDKLHKKIQRKQKRSNFAGLEAYAYIFWCFVITILLGIAFWICLAQSWTIAAWIIGVPFGIFSLFSLFFLFTLLV